MKKLIAIVVAMMLAVCAMAETRRDSAPRLFDICTVRGVDALEIVKTVQEVRDEFRCNLRDALQTDDDEQFITAMYMLYVLWQDYGDIAEDLFTIQK